MLLKKKMHFISSIGLMIYLLHSEGGTAQWLPEDAQLNTFQLATKYGHPPVQYEVVTEDGYILALYRLPGESKIPILLAHGLLDSSDTWLLRGNSSLAITLADKGHDVWLTNSRGNRYSRRHQRLSPEDASFWRYSFHEMGYYDLPAVIDTVLNASGATNLTAIGHSQGNTMFYVLGSERREYNAKINVLIALAPVAFLHHAPPPLAVLMQLWPALDSALTVLGVSEMFGDNTTSGFVLHRLCSLPGIGYVFCVHGLLFPFTGYDSLEMEPEFSKIAMTHFPAGTSAMSMMHFLQVGRSKKFAQYDHGNVTNAVLYNSSDPPVYHLKRVTMPVALFASANDYLSPLPDVDILKRHLANVVYDLVNPYLLFNHVDDVYGRRMKEYLFPYIFQVLNRFK